MRLYFESKEMRRKKTQKKKRFGKYKVGGFGGLMGEMTKAMFVLPLAGLLLADQRKREKKLRAQKKKR